MLCAEVCRFYGWTLEYSLAMPATQFFAMLDASRKIYAYENMVACDIHAISICDAKYHTHLKKHFQQSFVQSVVPEPPKRKIKGLEGAEAHQAVQAMFFNHKRSVGG